LDCNADFTGNYCEIPVNETNTILVNLNKTLDNFSTESYSRILTIFTPAESIISANSIYSEDGIVNKVQKMAEYQDYIVNNDLVEPSMKDLKLLDLAFKLNM